MHSGTLNLWYKAASYETEGFGPVVSFAEVTIGGKQYIAANHGNFISYVPVSGGLWQTAKAPGGTGTLDRHHRWRV